MINQHHHISSESTIEERIIYLLADKDKGALRLIYDNYSVILLNVIIRIVKHEDISKDVLQESLVKIWHKSTNFDRSKGSLFTWLVRICKNSAIDKTRSRDFADRQKSTEVLDVVFVSDSLGRKSNDDFDSLKELVSELPEIQRVLINMSFFEGFTHPEISEKLKMPLGTVKTKIRNALIHLRSII